VSRPPLLVRSLVTGRRYLSGGLIFLIGAAPFIMLATGIAEPPGTIMIVAIGLMIYAPFMIANTFLGYPRLVLSGSQLAIWNNALWPTRHDLDGYGSAYALLHYVRGIPQAMLVFRTSDDEAEHRSAEKFRYAPEYEETALKLPIAHFVGPDVEKAEALAEAINAHRGI
jgi:hypothetical protein